MGDRRREGAPARLFWSRGVSLTARILAVNIIVLGLLAGSLFYLDNYRKRLFDERFAHAREEAEVIAEALAVASRAERRRLMVRVGESQRVRLRLYDRRDRLVADSFVLTEPSFRFVDPATEPWYQDAARSIDRGMDFVLGAPRIPAYVEPAEKRGSAWPEVVEARARDAAVSRHRLAPDQTPVVTAAAPIGTRGDVLLTMRNSPELTQSVRDARQTLAIVVGVALLVSIQLSLFLARTIVQPLRMLVRAAVRVRLGRDREVVVPRLPERRDEIGLLARSISDMTAALRHRIDAVDRFAADVAHEIKNPLASLRSALESLDKVEDPALRRQLADIAAHDVQRIDRLVTEIADASRIDAEMSRTTLEPVEIGALVAGVVEARERRAADRGCRVAVRRGDGPYWVPGAATQLERVLENLLDNAVSFSDAGSIIEVELGRDGDDVSLTVCDRGPGIPQEAREKIFERFHSLRPATEDFGSHSGLGLSIARAIAEAHEGALVATDRPDSEPGACLHLRLPAWDTAW